MVHSHIMKESDAKLIWWICLILLLVSISVAVYEFVRQTRLALFGIKTDAICVRRETIGLGRARRLSYTFHFSNEVGTVIEVKDIFGPWEVKKVGDAIPIVYLPSTPKVVSLYGIRGWDFLLWTIFIGFVIGEFMRWWSRYWWR